jgi:hypothetical protein
VVVAPAARNARTHAPVVPRCRRPLLLLLLLLLPTALVACITKLSPYTGASESGAAHHQAPPELPGVNSRRLNESQSLLLLLLLLLLLRCSGPDEDEEEGPRAAAGRSGLRGTAAAGQAGAQRGPMHAVRCAWFGRRVRPAAGMHEAGAAPHEALATSARMCAPG